MSLMFDTFPSPKQAALFCLAVDDRYDLGWTIYMQVDAAQAHDPIPVELTPPVVHIDRPLRDADDAILTVRSQGGNTDLQTSEESELVIKGMAVSYGGKFVGT